MVLRSTPQQSKPSPTLRQEQQASPFFRLPGELRNGIYKILLISPESAARKHRATSFYAPSSSTSPVETNIFPAILSSCRRAHEEATSILYACNIFRAHSMVLTRMPFLLGSIRPILHDGVVAQIRSWYISVRLDTDPYFNAAEVTAAFSNADSLEVECWQAQFEACDYSALRLFQGVRGVGRAKVSGSVGYGFAHWLELVMESPKEMEEEMKTGSSTPGYVEIEGEDCGRAIRSNSGLPLSVWD